MMWEFDSYDTNWVYREVWRKSMSFLPLSIHYMTWCFYSNGYLRKKISFSEITITRTRYQYQYITLTLHQAFEKTAGKRIHFDKQLLTFWISSGSKFCRTYAETILATITPLRTETHEATIRGLCRFLLPMTGTRRNLQKPTHYSKNREDDVPAYAAVKIDDAYIDRHLAYSAQTCDFTDYWYEEF